MSRYTRRSALRLAGLGALSAVAGCTSSDGSDSPSETAGSPRTSDASEPTETATDSASIDTLTMGTTATDDDRSVTVSNPRVRAIIVTPDEGSAAHARPAGTAGAQFLTVDVAADDAIDTLALDTVLGGEPQGSSTFRHSFRPGNSGSVSLDVPVTDVRQGAVEWQPATGERHRWTLPSSLVSDLGATPAFDEVTFDGPETLASGEPFTATVTVSNDGDRDGVFRAMVLSEGASSLPLAESIEIAVGAGETVTRDISGATVTRAESDLTAVLDWGLGERRATVSVTQ